MTSRENVERPEFRVGTVVVREIVTHALPRARARARQRGDELEPTVRRALGQVVRRTRKRIWVAIQGRPTARPRCYETSNLSGDRGSGYAGAGQIHLASIQEIADLEGAQVRVREEVDRRLEGERLARVAYRLREMRARRTFLEQLVRHVAVGRMERAETMVERCRTGAEWHEVLAFLEREGVIE